MNARQQVSMLLEEAGQEYLSGNAIAEELGITLDTKIKKTWEIVE